MPSSLVFSEDRANGSASPQTHESATQSPRGRLLVVEHIRRMRGGSQPHLMRCAPADGYYIVKFQGNPQGTRILVNDLLGTQLAAQMGLPTTPVALCYVSEKLIELTPDLCVETPRTGCITSIRCRPGLQFGSRFPLDPHRVTVWDFLPDKQLRTVKNLGAFAGMLVFDKWTCNVDGRQTIFYQTEANAPYKTVMIDQGFCFNASEWTFPDAPLRGLYARKAVYERVRGLDDFEPWLNRLEHEISENVLIELAKNIPSEWYESKWDSLQRLLEQLDRRRSRVRELLWLTWKSCPNAFPNWTDGARRGSAHAMSSSVH